MSELLPCPFCGETPTLSCEPPEAPDGYFVTCDTDCCPGCVKEWMWAMTINQARKQWNRRQPVTPSQPQDVEYPQQNPIELGTYYLRHLNAMTREGLHDKSAIAEQLAWRDREIDRLRSSPKLPDQADGRKDWFSGNGDPPKNIRNLATLARDAIAYAKQCEDRARGMKKALGEWECTCMAPGLECPRCAAIAALKSTESEP